MNGHRDVLFVGLGSRHGDDRIGWAIADHLAEQHDAEIAVRHAASPVDLLDWIDEAEVLTVCDACDDGGEAGRLHRWNWPADEIATMRTAGTHDFSLVDVLRLAERLHRLPERVVVYGISGRDFSAGQSFSPGITAGLSEIVAAIREDLRDA